MNSIFYQRLAASTAHRPIRDELSGMVMSDKLLLPELIAVAVNTANKNHHKACWILELVAEAHSDWLSPYLDMLCDALPKYTNDSAIRPISKICLFAAELNEKQPGFLTTSQRKAITEACFDWLIDPDGKVAAKAYSMRTLYLLGKHEDWIHPELKQILAQDFPQHTAAYKSAAKDILKRLA